MHSMTHPYHEKTRFYAHHIGRKSSLCSNVQALHYARKGKQLLLPDWINGAKATKRKQCGRPCKPNRWGFNCIALHLMIKNERKWVILVSPPPLQSTCNVDECSKIPAAVREPGSEQGDRGAVDRSYLWAHACRGPHDGYFRIR